MEQKFADVVVMGILYLVGMAVYLLLSLGIAVYLVSTYNLVWWMFYLITGTFLLAGAHWSQIFEPREIIDLFYATGAISVVVLLVFGTRDLDFAITLGGIVIVAFVIHELSHKAIGLGFGNPARFTAFYTLNLVTVALAYFTGFLFLVPGAVQDVGITERVWGIVAAAGPVSNIVLAVLFIWLGQGHPEIARIGVIVNIALAGFNMLPIPPLDGAKVWQWSPSAYAFIAGFVLVSGYQIFSPLL